MILNISKIINDFSEENLTKIPCITDKKIFQKSYNIKTNLKLASDFNYLEESFTHTPEDKIIP